jgi:hypothetical protein
VIEFRTNGLRQSELCRIHGLTRWTLQPRSQERAYRLRFARRSQRAGGGRGDRCHALVRRKPEEGYCGLEVILAKGRRIELSRDFDECNCVVPSRTITQTTELTPAAWINRNVSPTSPAL